MQHHTTEHARSRRLLRPAVALAAAALCIGAIAPVVGAATRAPAAQRTAHGVVISMATESFGPQLVVGNGQFKGFSVYAITSDSATTFGCTTVVFHGPGGQSFPCTGPDTSNASEWPAVITTAAPVAGPGVNQALLRSVFRKGIGHQVTYNGHPLYLFDQGPGQITGEGWDEPTLPPWHGQWWLVNPDGTFQEWSQTLTASSLADNTVALSALMMTGAGFHALPLYSFSVDTPTTSYCGPACSRLFEPLLTTGRPGIEGTTASGAVGSLTRSDGTIQVTYNGHPLYLYANEVITRVPGRGFTATGSGDGKAVGSGTFHLVTP
jgi:predicted lipoprotein with Yx(FWY)xxD motif